MKPARPPTHTRYDGSVGSFIVSAALMILGALAALAAIAIDIAPRL